MSGPDELAVRTTTRGNALTDTAVEIETPTQADDAGSGPAAPQAVDQAAAALRSHAFIVEIAETPDDARVLVDTLVDDGPRS